MSRFPAHVPVAVVGGGQAGLATSYELTRRGVEHVVLDGAPAAGHSWRSRWDSLRLFTPARHSCLPGMDFPAAGGHHPTKDEVAAYLTAYREHFGLPVRFGARVDRIGRTGPRFDLAVGDDRLIADQVVVATGPFQVPVVPRVGRGLDASVRQVHTAQYRGPDQLPAGGTVLVVGAGNSGVQVAQELAATCRVHLVGREASHLPQRVLGRDVFDWMVPLGFADLRPDSRMGRRMATRQLVIGTSEHDLARAGVVRRPRLARTWGRIARFEDGTYLEVDAVVWATGFRTDHSFVDIPGALDDRLVIRQYHGAGFVPGLHTVGLPWQRNRGSALLGFVGRDAAVVAGRVAAGAGADIARTASRQRALAG